MNERDTRQEIDEEGKSELVANLLQLVGTLSENEATHLLSASNWNIEVAADLAISGADESVGRSFPSSADLIRKFQTVKTSETATTTTETEEGHEEEDATAIQSGQSSVSILDMLFIRLRVFLYAILSIFGVQPATFRQRAHDRPDSCFEEIWEQKYSGLPSPTLATGTYMETLVESRRDLRFMLVYLHSELHGETNSFCREVIASSEFIEFIEEQNMLFFAQSVSNPDGLAASQKLGVTAFPYLGLHVPTQVSDSNGIVQTAWRHEGTRSYRSEDALSILSELRIVVNIHRSSTERMRRNRAELETSRMIRDEQDQAYQQSLREDAEREQEKLAKEEEERQERELLENKARKIQLHKAKLKQCAQDALREEPEKGTEDTTRICFRLRSGVNRIRIFYDQDPVAHLYYYIDSVGCGEEEFDYVLENSYPKKKFERGDKTPLKEAGLAHSGTVYIQEQEFGELPSPREI